MDDFDLTQPMSLCFEDEDPIQETNEVAILKIPLQDGILHELEFSLFNGVNKIGRSDSCEVCINNKVLSKEHAVIEVGGDCFLIYDLSSSNKTWRGKKPLKPNVKYKLDNNEEVRFGNIKTQFIIKKQEVDDKGDSGSETGSESMLLLNEEYHAFSVSTPVKNADVNEGGNDPSRNASTSNALFSKNLSAVEAKKAQSPKEDVLDLENAATQEYNGANLSDSGDETDCEDHSVEKPVTKEKEMHSDSVADPHCGDKTVNRQTSGNKAVITENVDYGGVSGISSKSFEKSSDRVQKDGNVINTVVHQKNSFNKHQLPECHSLESNEDLPATQLNLAVMEHGVMDDRGSMQVAKELNNEHEGEVLGSLDSLPETQLNTRNYDLNLEIPESTRAETNDDLPPTQCISDRVVNNFNNNGLKQKDIIFESDDETKDSDDLPATQPNLALQFSEEQNFLQHDNSQCSYNKSSLSPRASTSSDMNWFGKTAGPILYAGSSCRQSNIPGEENPGKTSRGSFTTNKSSTVPLLTSINIVEEGNTVVEDSSILCPSTQRCSDVCDHKINNTEIHCSPSLVVVSTQQGKDSIAETPPYLLKESTLVDGNSSMGTSRSKRIPGVSPIALRISDSPSHSHCDLKTSDDPYTPSTSGKLEVKVSTPDSAKAGELNYSGNYSPKVLKTKLGNLDKSSQEILHSEQSVSEAVNSSMLKDSSKVATPLKPHTEKPTVAKELMLTSTNEDRPESSDVDDTTDKKERKGKQSKRHKAAKKTEGHGTEERRSTAAKRISPDSCTSSKTKKSKTRESRAGSKLPHLSPDQHNLVSSDHEDDSQSKMPQRRKSKRCHVAPPKHINLESDIPKKPRIESSTNGKNEEQSSIPVYHGEQSIFEDSVSSVSSNNLKSDANRSSTRKKKCRNDQNIQLLPTRKSKRQRFVLNKSGENYDKQDVHGEDISSDIMKERNESDSKDDFASIPLRKTARRKPLQSEQDRNAPDSKQEVGFCAFRKSEALDIEKDSLSDSQTLKKGKAAVPSKGDHKEGFTPFKGQSSKLNQLALNESEISVSSSGEQCNISVRSSRSNEVENLKSGASDKKISCGDESFGRKKRGACDVTELSVPVQRLPLLPQQPSRTKRKTRHGPGKNEMQNDLSTETMKCNGQSTSAENEVEGNTLNRKESHPDKKQISPLRRSHRKEIPSNDSIDESRTSRVSLDISTKTEDEDSALTGLKKNCFENKHTPRSRQLRKKEEIFHSNPVEDCLSSAISLDSSTRSLWSKLRLSTSETSADEKPNASEKCQISVFAKDSVKSLIKLNATGTNQSENFQGVQSRVRRKSKLSKKEENEAEIPKVENNRQSQPNFDSKAHSSPPLGPKKNKRHQSLNSSSVSDSISEKDLTPAKSKKAQSAKNKHVAFTSPSSRQQHHVQKPKVMFTMVEDEEPQKVVVNLGGRVVEDVNVCTHLVADKLRRTVKALCCIAKGIPLVNTKWLQECKKSESFVDHVPYLIADKAAEKQYKFELQKTIQRATEKPLLSSWNIHVTPKVVPSPEQMKDIIQCAGGKYLPKMPNRLSEKTVVITCAPDLNLCSHAAKCGIPVVGSEFILTGILQYKIDMKSYMLSKN